MKKLIVVRCGLMRFLITALAILSINTSMATKQDKFINRYSLPAIFTGIFNDVPPSITMAQAIIESGWGESSLTTEANNFFGVKSHNWGGATISMPTQEYGANGYYTINSDFRKYRSAFHSFRDHAKFLHENGRYDGLFELGAADFEGWAYGLQRAGYATSPNYGATLVNVINTYGLDRLDRIAITTVWSFIAVIAIVGAFIYTKYIG